jgi:hypothetical protein
VTCIHGSRQRWGEIGDIRDSKYQKIRLEDEEGVALMSNFHTGDHGIQFCTDVILREARNETRLVNQILLTMLSAFTNNPINLAINSPSGEGKSYVLHKVGKLFSPQDVMFVAGMSDKALFHRRGSLVIKNEAGEYETIEEKIGKIDSVIEDKESEVAISTDANLKRALRNEIKELQKQKKDLKLIDLSHKITLYSAVERLLQQALIANGYLAKTEEMHID